MPSIVIAGFARSPFHFAKKGGLINIRINDIDLVELNEAFASQSLACVRELGLDMDKVNLDGGG